MIFGIDSDRIFAKLVLLTAIFIFASFTLEFSSPGYVEERLNRQKTSAAALVRVGEADAPELSAEAVYAERLLTGEVLYAKNETKIFAPASLVKLMTALLFVESAKPLELVFISEEAKLVLEPDEKKSSVRPGEAVKAEDLLKLIAAESDNDAAYAAAEAAALRAKPGLAAQSFSERVTQFVFMMNERREKLGMSGSHFMNPTGRDNLLNYSTAADLAVLAKEIYKSTPEVWSASRLHEGEIYSREGTRHEFKNTNVLLKEFPAIYGSKTGFTDEAEEALLMLYELAYRDPVVVVILKSKDRFGDGRAFLRWLDESFRIKLPAERR